MPTSSTGARAGAPIASCLCELRAHDHLCLVYESRAEQLAALAPFLKHGLDVGDRCLYVADARTVSDLAPALGAEGIDVEGEVRRGAFTLATERETYLAGGELDPDAMLDLAAGAAARAVREGHGGLRIAGEMTWALGDRTRLERLMEYEIKVNQRIATVPVVAVCQYDRRRFAPEIIRDVIRTHPLIAVRGRACRNFYFVPPGELAGPDRLQHEVDRLLENVYEREQAEDALRESERRLALAGRLAAVGTLVAGIAHEINNPLAYVAANLRYLADRLPAGGDRAGEALHQALAEAIDGADRVAGVVQGLRRFAGPPGDGRRGPVDVGAEIDAAVGIARHQVVGRARLVVEVATSLPPVVAGTHELGQVVVNLLVNAAQAIPEGRAAKGEVKLIARAQDGRVVIEVADTGIGISADLLPRIFDPFFTTKPVGTGTGLGLAICHDIVSRAGGTIQVRSECGRGTVFRVELPAVPVAAPAPAPPPAAATRRRRRVLVVDDEPLVGRALARMLAREHDVEVLTSPREAARRAEAGERWDVVLCDLLMPELSGMALAERLERVAPDLARRLVFTTGGAYTDASRAFLAAPGRRHLEKPFDGERLRELVTEVGDLD